MYFPLNAPAVIKLEIMKWTGHVARTGLGKVLTGVGGDTREKRNHLEETEVDDRIIIKWIFEKPHTGMDWNDLAQNKSRWRAVVNAVMILRVP